MEWTRRRYITAMWLLIAVMAALRLAASLYLLERHYWMFTLSADDIARLRAAFLWAESPSWMPDSTWPPLPFWLGGILVWLGVGYSSLNALNLFASLATLPLIAWLGDRLLKPLSLTPRRRLAFIGAGLLVFAASPRWIHLGTSMLAEPLYIFLITAGVCLFVAAIERDRIEWALGSLVAFFASALTRYEGVALILIVWIVGSYAFRNDKRARLAGFIAAGAILLAAFPMVWAFEQWQSGRGVMGYLEALRGGYSSQHGYGFLATPYRMMKLYFATQPLLWFFILAGLAVGFASPLRNSLSRSARYYAVAAGLYCLAQLAGSAAGLMPSHSFWRLAIPFYVIMIPFALLAFERLFHSVPLVIACMILLGTVHNAPSFRHSHVYLNDELYLVSTYAKDKLSGEGPVLIEVNGWDWLAISFIGFGNRFEGVVYDRDPWRPYEDSNLSAFEDDERIEALFEDRQPAFAVVESREADEELIERGWIELERFETYAIFIRTRSEALPES